MKTKFLLFPILATALITMSGCSSDEPGSNPNPDPDPEPGPTVQPGSYGVYVVNSGQQTSNIVGSLGYLDYETKTMTQDVFYDANGQYVGDTFNDGYILDNQIYLAVTDSRVLHVIDRSSHKLLKTIQPSTLAGPRRITAYDGYIYCTLFGSPGYLCRVNPETFEYQTIEVGPQPEYVVAFNGKIYVAVSDSYSATYSESCIAVVNPSTFKVEKTITGIKNPVQLATNGTQLFVCSWGEYDENWNQVNYGVQEIIDDKVTGPLYQGNYMALNGNLLYYIDAPWDAPEFRYWVLNTETKERGEWISSVKGVYYPNNIGVDPGTGNVFVLSFNPGEYGYPSYTSPGYVNMYSSTGELLGEFETGVGPTAVFANYYE